MASSPSPGALRDQRHPYGLIARSLLGALVGPLVLVSVYLTLSRWPTRWFTGESDLLALAVAIAFGIAWIVRLPVSMGLRVGLAIAYVPVMGFSLILYALNFVGVMFGDWL